MKCSLFEKENKPVLEQYAKDRKQKINDDQLWHQDPARETLLKAHALWQSDPAQALKIFREHAEQGSVVSMNEVAMAYRMGKGVPIDMDQAEMWGLRALRGGSNGALMRLLNIYREQRNYKKAEEVSLPFIEAGFTPAMNSLALLYLETSRSRESRARAETLLQKALASGDKDAKLLYMKNLARGRFGLLKIPKGLAMTKDVMDDVRKIESDLKPSASTS